MIELLEAVDLCLVGHEGSVLRVTILEDDNVCSTVNKRHCAHEARLDVCEDDEVFEVVKLVCFSLLSLNR